MTAATSTWAAVEPPGWGAGAADGPDEDCGGAGGAGAAEAGPPKIEDMMLPKMLIAALLMPVNCEYARLAGEQPSRLHPMLEADSP